MYKISNKSLLIADFKESSNITIGVPHHTPGGTSNMPCPEHPDGDENAAFIGELLSKRLNCSLIVACNYFIDSNKCRGSDYFLAVEKSNPKYLIEIHGHGGKKTPYDIEISCGSKQEEKYALELKTKLLDIIGRDTKKWACLKIISIESEFDKIYFQATNSVTIIDKRWKSYHIELSPKLRIDQSNNQLPDSGYKFAEVLSIAFSEICK